MNTDDRQPSGGSVTVIIIRPPCPGDADGNGQVDMDDFVILVKTFGPCPTGGAPCPCDFDDDGQVAASDFFLLLAGWGDCP